MSNEELIIKSLKEINEAKSAIIEEQMKLIEKLVEELIKAKEGK